MTCDQVESFGHRCRTFGAAVPGAIRSVPCAILGRVDAVRLAKGADEAASARIPDQVSDLPHIDQMKVQMRQVGVSTVPDQSHDVTRADPVAELHPGCCRA